MEDKEQEQLVADIIRKLASMSPAEFAAFKEFFKARQPELFELLFVEADYSEVDPSDHFGH